MRWIIHSIFKSILWCARFTYCCFLVWLKHLTKRAQQSKCAACSSLLCADAKRKRYCALWSTGFANVTSGLCHGWQTSCTSRLDLCAFKAVLKTTTKMLKKRHGVNGDWHNTIECWYFIILSCIDAVVVILGDWRDTGAGMTDSQGRADLRY